MVRAPRVVLLATGLLLLGCLPVAAGQDGTGLRWEDVPERMDAPGLDAGGHGGVPVTLVLRVDATRCEDAAQVPVVVGAEGTEGLQATLDRARHVFQVPPGAVHEVRATLQLALGGAGAGAVTLRAHAEGAAGSCVAQAGGAAMHVIRVGPGASAAADAGGTVPITLRGADPVPRVLLAAAAGLLALLVLRARPSRGS